MNDLRNGIIDINGFLVGPDTDRLEMEQKLNLKATTFSSGSSYLYKFKNVINEGLVFDVDVWFSGNGKIRKIKMFPITDIRKKYDLIDPYSDEVLQLHKEIRAILDDWLKKQIGEPDYIDDTGTEYENNIVFISTFAYFSKQRDNFPMGGYLRISYR